MVTHMKTTIDISDSLFKDAKRCAGEQGIPLREIVESALRDFLKIKRNKKKKFQLRKHPFKGYGLSRDLTEGDWNSIRKRIYEGRGG